MIPFPPHAFPDRTVLDSIANLLLLGAGVGAVVFLIGYGVLFRWWETSSGRVVLGFVGALVLILGLNLAVRAAGGDFPGRDVLRVVVDSVAFVAAWGLVALLVKSWLRGATSLDIPDRDSTRRTPTKEQPVTASDLPAELDGEALVPVDERTLNNVEIADLGDGSKIVATNLGVPTQVANPGRATLRTVVAVLVGLVLALPTVNAVLLVIRDELAASGVILPGWVTVTINGAIAAVALVSAVVTRVLAIPGVNAWLASHALTRGLTAIPLKATNTLDPVY